MKKYILGLHIGHDASVALLESNTVISAISEERFSRVKNHNGFPYQSLSYLAAKYKIDNKVLLGVALTHESAPAPFVTDILFNPCYADQDLFFSVPEKFVLKYHLNTVSRIVNRMRYEQFCAEYYNKKLREALGAFGIEVEVFSFGHHLCHAASAYYSAGKEKMLLITADGLGEDYSATVNIGTLDGIKQVYSTSKMHSAGRYYSALTSCLGFKIGSHEGKITGLAAFGDYRNCYEAVKALLRLSQDKVSFRTDLVCRRLIWRKLYSIFHTLKTRKFYDYAFEAYKKEFMKLLSSRISREDLSAAVQKRLEDVVVEHIHSMMERFQIYDVGLAGGVFANVKLNQRIAEIEKIRSLFIHPHMGDGGLAFGAAFLLASRSFKEPVKLSAISDVYLGPEYSEGEVFAVLDRQRESLDFKKAEDDIEKRIALLLSESKIVALFQGRMEYGPRALGNRTLLADPRNRRINDILNQRLKRSEFMPFAPAILEERAADILIGYDNFIFPAQFMTLTFNVQPDWRNKIPAVVHIDGTLRPQVVRKEINPRFHKIIKEYEMLTGIPLLINTSFNMHENPIVCSPEDAVEDFLAGAADVLILEDFVVNKKENLVS